MREDFIFQKRSFRINQQLCTKRSLTFALPLPTHQDISFVNVKIYIFFILHRSRSAFFFFFSLAFFQYYTMAGRSPHFSITFCTVHLQRGIFFLQSLKTVHKPCFFYLDVLINDLHCIIMVIFLSFFNKTGGKCVQVCFLLCNESVHLSLRYM